MQTGRRLLLVDDDRRLTSILGMILTSEGFDLTIANDGLEGGEAVAEGPFDVIILDAMMPGLDGRDLCRQLKADPATADMPIILFSCLADLEKEDNLPADAILTKPTQVAELLEQVQALLRVRS